VPTELPAIDYNALLGVFITDACYFFLFLLSDPKALVELFIDIYGTPGCYCYLFGI
jgi:hypothetical protein